MHNQQTSTIFALGSTRTTNSQPAHNMLILCSLYIHLLHNDLILIASVDAMLIGSWLYLEHLPPLVLIGLILPLSRLPAMQQIDKLSGARQMATTLLITTDQQMLAKTSLSAAVVLSQCALGMFLAMGQWHWIVAAVAIATTFLYVLSNLIIYSIFD